MSGPWEEFQSSNATVERGPWDDFKSAPAAPKFDASTAKFDPQARGVFQPSQFSSGAAALVGPGAAGDADLTTAIGEGLKGAWEFINTPLYSEPETTPESTARHAMEMARAMEASPAQAQEEGAVQRGEVAPPVVGNVAEGVATGTYHLAQGFTSPLGIATLGIGSLPATAQRAVSLGFAAQMISDSPEISRQLGEEFGKPEDQRDVAKISQLITEGAGTAAFTTLAAKHGLAPARKTAPIELISRLAPLTAEALRVRLGEVAERRMSLEPTGERIPVEGRRAEIDLMERQVGQPELQPAVTPKPVVPRFGMPSEAKPSAPGTAEVAPVRSTEGPVQVPAEVKPQAAIPETPKQPELVGMGGAVASEFELTPLTPTSLKNARVDIERQQRGLPPAVQPARKSFGAVWDQVTAKIDNDPGYQDRLVNELREKPRALTDAEDAALLHRQIDLQNEYGKATRDLAQAFDDGRMDAVGEQKARVSALSDQLLDLYNINKKVGTETGRGLNARKMMAYEDFSLAKMELEKRAVNDGRPLTDAERTEVTALNQKIETTQKAYDDYVSKTDARIAELEIKRALDEVEATAKKEPTYPPEVLSTAERIVRGFEKRADAATVRLKQKFAQLGSGPDPTIIFDLAEIGVAKLGRAVLDFTSWAAAMRLHLGEELTAKVEPFLKEAFEASGKMLESDLAKLNVPEKVKRAVKKQDFKDQGDSIGDAIKRKVEAGQKNDIAPQAQKLARLFVELGVKDRNALIDSVHGELKKYIPEITRRETMDAISGYGDFKQLTKDAISVQLRDLKGQMQQVGKLEDMRAGQAPQKTGVERRTPSDEERRLIQQVEEAKKKGGYVVTDPATQLRSALQSIKTRLENQIADLEHEIATKTKIVREKTELPTSSEVEALKVRRDELKASRDALFGKRELTDEQRVKAAMAAVEKSIAEYERRIKSGELETAKSTSRTPATPELEAARAKRDALKEQLQELRDLDPALQAERRSNALESEKRALEKTIAEQERRLSEGDLSTKGAAMNRPADPVLEPLRQRRDYLSKQLDEARKKPAEQKHAEMLQRRLEAVNKLVAEKEAKIATGDVSPAPKNQNRPLTPELEMAKQRLELLNKQIAELRNPSKTPEERALQSLKARLANQIETLQDKLARGDFSKKEKRIVQMDSEANRLHFEAAKAKIAWHEALMKDRLANRTVPLKILGTVSEVLNTSRAILTSMDLSAVLRQGGFIALAHPIRAAKSFPEMFKAFRSEAGQHAVNQEILGRKNYPLYNQSKLYLSEHGQKLSQMEEAYMSRWADNIPLVAGSQRAYVTLLNKLRADSFDAMANSLSRSGEITPVEANAIANFINVATGRGNIGMKENYLVSLNTIFFAPRYVASRFQLLAGQPLYGGNARTRSLIAKEYARYLIGVGVVYGLATLDGAEIEQDPRSSDFGKLRYGNTRLDPLSGLSQATVLLSRLATGETKKLDGKMVPIVGKVPFGQDDAFDVGARFLRTKLAPVPSALINLRTGEDVVGQPVTAESTAEGLLVPLAFRDIYDAMIEQGVPRGTAFALLSLFGIGLQNYDEQKRP